VSVLLQAEHLRRSLAGDPPVRLVADASLSIDAGTFATIVGPSGCGKSSLLYLLGLLDRPDQGALRLSGADLSTLDGDARARLRLRYFGFVFQFHFLLPEFSALENVMLPMRRLGELTTGEARDRAEYLLGSMGLRDKVAMTPDRLSGGERQRVAIARALANDPILVLGDEPTGNLDSGNSARVVEILKMLAHDEKRAVICVTHDPRIADASDLRIEMLDGKVTGVEAGAQLGG
jgi:lipoprotein-releasing system ATP-binding protein